MRLDSRTRPLSGLIEWWSCGTAVLVASISRRWGERDLGVDIVLIVRPTWVPHHVVTSVSGVSPLGGEVMGMAGGRFRRTVVVVLAYVLAIGVVVAVPGEPIGQRPGWLGALESAGRDDAVPSVPWRSTPTLVWAAPSPARVVFTAIVYVLTSGYAWRDLPPTFGVPFQTAHRRFSLEPRRFRKLVWVVAQRGGDAIADGPSARQWALPLADRVQLVATYWRTNLTMMCSASFMLVPLACVNPA
jgi:Putative transposase of IS4/5 family (DUF4096)